MVGLCTLAGQNIALKILLKHNKIKLPLNRSLKYLSGEFNDFFTVILYTCVVRHARIRTRVLGQSDHNATIGQSEHLCS